MRRILMFEVVGSRDDLDFSQKSRFRGNSISQESHLERWLSSFLLVCYSAFAVIGPAP